MNIESTTIAMEGKKVGRQTSRKKDKKSRHKFQIEKKVNRKKRNYDQ